MTIGENLPQSGLYQPATNEQQRAPSGTKGPLSTDELEISCD